MRILVQLQLSNYDTKGKFILEADSGWQMCMGRVREILKLLPETEIDIIGPKLRQLKTYPRLVNPDLFSDPRISYHGLTIPPNALATRYHFDIKEMTNALHGRKYDWVYINDPMLLRNFRALFFLYLKHMPMFAVHSHFIDNPSCPKFPIDASLWMGQLEASVKADINFWQCQSALDIYKEEAKRTILPSIVDQVMAKSYPWDDGYSSTEINRSVDEKSLRFKPSDFYEATREKTIIFVPNRIGGRGRSSDYTNCGKFLFDILPELHRACPDKYVVIAGNPSQKFTNQELEAELKPYGFLNLTKDGFTREEYIWLGKRSHLALGLYDQDSYGGTAARELIDLGCYPVWLDKYEYGQIMREWFDGRASLYCLASDLDAKSVIRSITHMTNLISRDPYQHTQRGLRRIVQERCSYESTTPRALKAMGLL